MSVAVAILLGLLVVVVLTVATGYFVAQEFAYVSVDRTRLRQLADDGDAAAARALGITGRLSFALSGAQFGITVTALLVGYAGEPLIGTALAEALGFTGLSSGARLSISVVLVLAFSTALQMVIGELFPKNLAIARPVPLARSLSRSTQVYLAVAGPVVRLFDSASNGLLRAVGIEPVEQLEPGATSEDLEHLIEESARGGTIDAQLSELLERGLGFRVLTAEQAMTPRVRVVTVAHRASVADVLDVLRASGHSRFPVVGDDVDDVVGVVGLAEVLRVPREHRAATLVADVASAPVVVPGSVPLPGALELLRSEHRQLAVVVDEFGGFDGVLSLEDIAEEVVGDILDEEEPDADADAQRTAGTTGSAPEGPVTLPATMRLDEVEAATGLRLPEGPAYSTVSGLVLSRLGRVARVGDRVEVDEPPEPGLDQPGSHRVVVEVDEVERHVPRLVTLTRVADGGSGGGTP